MRPVLTTKTFHPMAPGEDRGLAPARVRRQVESSLARLGVDSIDLYLTHEPDPETSLNDTLDALDELVEEDKIGAYGGSHLAPALLQQSNGRYRWVQNSFSLLDRADEPELLPLVEKQGLGYTPYSPLAGGWLTGKYAPGQAAPPGSRMSIRPGPYEGLDRDDVWRGLERMRGWAERHGLEMATVAYAWVLGDPHVTAVLVGPRRPAHMEAAVRALDLTLTGQEREELRSFFTGSI